MLKDDRCGIIYGLMGMFQDDAGFLKLKDNKWVLDEYGLINHLTAIKDAGANGIRTLPWGVWGSHPGQNPAYQFQPYVLKGGKWDLSTFNTHYFSNVKKAFEIINGLNMTAILSVFDNCQLHGGYRKWSPWYSNVQGITSFYDKAADKYSRTWLTFLTKRFGGYDVIWGFGNELENKAAPDFAKRVLLPFVKSKSLPFDRLTYGATTKIVSGDSNQDVIRNAVEDTFGKTAERSIIMEDHGFPFTASLPAWGNKPWRKLYSDDGCYTGKSLCDKNARGSRPSAVEWQAKAAYILNHYPAEKNGMQGLINFEHLTAVYPPNADCQAGTIRAISGAYKAKFKCWPKNYKPA